MVTTEPLDTQEAAQAYLDRVFRPGVTWSMLRFEYGWAIRSIPVTEEQFRQDRQPGRSTLVLEANTGRITSHGPYPQRLVIQRYLAAIAEGRPPGGSQIYPERPPEDPGPNAERLAPTPPDGSTRLYYFARILSEKPGPVIVTILRSGPDGHRSIRWSPSDRAWKCGGVTFLAQDRYAAQFRLIDRAEAERLHRERLGMSIPTENELHQLCAENRAD